VTGVARGILKKSNFEEEKKLKILKNNNL